ncbi:uncharacterized protein LOC143032780 [Oratosquilla oratoria]|uniref:uncharacterized protein LOC143032780 n=1 Tax=Oratosquilla oratoria TaxID=337810 RepID=UPI003F767382
MPNKCCVPHCKGNYQTGPQVSAFSFPNDEDLRARWLRAIRRADFTPTRQTKVCELHFAPEDIIRSCNFTDDGGKHQNHRLDRPRLTSGAVPYIMPNKRSFIAATAPSRKNPPAAKRASAAGTKEEHRRQMIVLVTYRDIVKLISEVRKRPSIWDPTDDNYRNKIKKIEVWDEISRAFCPDYDQKSPTEKDLIEKELQGRWKSIRDSYSKNKRKTKPRPGSSKIRQYIYTPHLSFLNDVHIPRKVAAPSSDSEAMELAVDVTPNFDMIMPQSYSAKAQVISAQVQALSAQVQAHSAQLQAPSAQEYAYSAQEQGYSAQEQMQLAQELARSALEHSLSAKAQTSSAKPQRRSAQKRTRSAHGQILSTKAQTRLAKLQTRLAQEQAHLAQEETHSALEHTHSAQEHTHSAPELTHSAQEQTYSAQEIFSEEKHTPTTEEQMYYTQEQPPSVQEQTYSTPKHTRSATQVQTRSATQLQTPTAPQPQGPSEANNEKTISLEERLIQFMETHEEQDEDKDFLMSMLPSLKTLNQEQKIEFRIQTLNMFRSIKFGHTVHTQFQDYCSPTTILPSVQPQFMQFTSDYSRPLTPTHDQPGPSSPTNYSPFDIEVKQQADFESDSTEGNM